MLNYTFYALPTLDARIGIAVEGGRIAFTFLAEGCSRKGKEGAYTYTRRNPDRRKAANALFCLAKLGSVVCGALRCRGGKAINGPDKPATIAEALALFRKGGNYRFELQGTATDLDLDTAEAIAEALGLEPVANRPIKVNWL
tara:strand:- start:1498 stop:1923 length:426 start_codon:yes stop_codon:yes gene_type:complete